MRPKHFSLFLYRLKRVFLTFVLIGVVFFGYGQSVNALYPTMPTSPQAESFKKYGDYSVSNAVGIPDISIPLYEIDHFGFKIPVILRYNPQPIKQSYNFDVYGYGWGLSVNSSVSRQVNHVADERTNFILDQPYQNMPYRLCGLDCHSGYNYTRDLFTVTLPDGSSFDFYMVNNNGTIEYLISGERHVKLQYISTSVNIEWFKVTDENGVLYTFDVPETGHPSGGGSGANVSWQLSRIDVPHTPYPILFSNQLSMQSLNQTICYEPTVKIGTRQYFDAQDILVKTNTAELYMSSGNRHDYNMTLLNEIYFGDGLMRIIYKNPSNSAQNYVEKIQITDGATVVKEIIFDSFSTPVYSMCGTSSLRRLQKLTLKGSDNSEPEVYNLDYHSINVGGGTDHWGYLNGSSQQAMPNFNFFLEHELSGLDNQASTYIYGLAARTRLPTDISPWAKVGFNGGSDLREGVGPESHGILSKITYPTGGWTTFGFESHRFFSQTDYDGNYIHNKSLRTVKYGGGFRIANISSYSSAGVVSGTKTYFYGKPNGYGDDLTGAGEAVADPTLLSYLDFSSLHFSGTRQAMYQLDHPVPYLLLGLDVNGALNTFQNPYDLANFAYNQWEWEATMSANNFRRLLAGRPPVVYDMVTVYDVGPENLGKTVYKYFMPMTQGYGEEIVYYGNVMGAEGHPYLYNRLLEKTEYAYNAGSSTYLPLKKQSNEWQYNTLGVSGYKYANYFPDHLREIAPIELFVSQLYVPSYTTIGGAKLVATALTEYDAQGDSIVNSTSFSHNSRNQLVSKLSLNSYNETMETTMTYPEPSSNGPTPAVIQKMLDKNMISSVIESKSFVGGTITSGSRTEYAEFPSGSSTIVLPARTLQMEFKDSGPEYALQGEVLRYSPNGKPTEYEFKGGNRNVYIWGYGDQYMIAEIKNTTYNDVAAALASLGISDIQNQISLQGTPNMLLINQLRQQLPGAQVSTFTYKPLVGITSATQPNGLVTTYTYNSSGKLKDVRDHDGNIRSAYQYHFKAQP